MRESGEFPIIPDLAPEEAVHSWRYESSDLDINKLVEYLHNTIFESEDDVKNFLIDKYRMSRKTSIDQIGLGMTRVWSMNDAIDIVDENGVLNKYKLRNKENLIK